MQPVSGATVGSSRKAATMLCAQGLSKLTTWPRFGNSKKWLLLRLPATDARTHAGLVIGSYVPPRIKVGMSLSIGSVTREGEAGRFQISQISSSLACLT
jgi:hypothetical protein